MQEIDAENRLGQLERHAERTEGRLSVIERTQNIHSDKLDKIITAVTQQGARPQIDIHELIRSAASIVTVVAALAALLIWVITRMTEADTRVLQTRLDYQSQQIDFIKQLSFPVAAVSTHRENKLNGPER